MARAGSELFGWRNNRRGNAARKRPLRFLRRAGLSDRRIALPPFHSGADDRVGVRLTEVTFLRPKNLRKGRCRQSTLAANNVPVFFKNNKHCQERFDRLEERLDSSMRTLDRDGETRVGCVRRIYSPGRRAVGTPSPVLRARLSIPVSTSVGLFRDVIFGLLAIVFLILT
jgi:hypothetical protein